MFRSLCVACLLPSSVALALRVDRRECGQFGYSGEVGYSVTDLVGDTAWLCSQLPDGLTTVPCPDDCPHKGMSSDALKCTRPDFCDGQYAPVLPMACDMPHILEMVDDLRRCCQPWSSYGTCQPACGDEEYVLQVAKGNKKAVRACPFVDSTTESTDNEFPLLDPGSCVRQIIPGGTTACRLEVRESSGEFTLSDSECEKIVGFSGCKRPNRHEYYPDAEHGQGGWTAKTERVLQPVRESRRLAERTERDQRRRFSPILFVGLCSVDVPGIDVTAINQRENCNNDDGGWKCYDENLDFSCCGKATLAECTS